VLEGKSACLYALIFKHNEMTTIKFISEPHPNSRRPKGDEKQVPYLEPTSVDLIVTCRSPLGDCKLVHTFARKEKCFINCTENTACRYAKLFARSPGARDSRSQFLRELNFGDWLSVHA